jgi:ubiquinone/menaquinone biosynthesis C-methylase UbiE
MVDLGCGTGQLTRRLVERFPASEVVGIDYSAGMLTQARDRLTDTAALVRADAQLPPLRPGSVDVVVCTESFHWYRDQQRTLSSLANVLRPGGRLVIASIAAVTTVGQSALRTLSTGAGQPVRARTPRQLRSLLNAADFEVLHQRRIPRVGLIPWPVLTDAQRR